MYHVFTDSQFVRKLIKFASNCCQLTLHVHPQLQLWSALRGFVFQFRLIFESSMNLFHIVLERHHSPHICVFIWDEVAQLNV